MTVLIFKIIGNARKIDLWSMVVGGFSFIDTRFPNANNAS